MRQVDYKSIDNSNYSFSFDKKQLSRANIRPLEETIIEKEKEIERLNGSLRQITEKQKKFKLFCEMNIKSLIALNKEANKRIEQLQNENQKLYKTLNHHEMRYSKNQLKRSVNSLSSKQQQEYKLYTQNENKEKCKNNECLKLQKQILRLRRMISEITKALSNLLEQDSQNQDNILSPQIFNTWKNQFEQEIKSFKQSYFNHSFLNFQKIKDKMEDLTYNLKRPNNLKKDQELFHLINSIRNKKQNLVSVPFLPKYDADTIEEECDLIIKDSLQKKNRIMKRILKQTN